MQRGIWLGYTPAPLAEPFVPMVVLELSEKKNQATFGRGVSKTIQSHYAWVLVVEGFLFCTHFYRNLKPSRNGIFLFLGRQDARQL